MSVGPLLVCALSAVFRMTQPAIINVPFRLWGRSLSDIGFVVPGSISIIGVCGLIIASIDVFPVLAAEARYDGSVCVQCAYCRSGSDIKACPECGDTTTLMQCRQMWREYLVKTSLGNIANRLHGASR